MKLSQFSLRDLLVATMLIGVGLCLLTVAHDTFVLAINAPVAFNTLRWLLPWYLAGAAIGAGLFTPFHKKMIGSMLGIVVQQMLISTVWHLWR